jgi:hypothetical protein
MQIEMERVKVVIYPDGRLDTDNAARFLGLSPRPWPSCVQSEMAHGS